MGLFDGASRKIVPFVPPSESAATTHSCPNRSVLPSSRNFNPSRRREISIGKQAAIRIERSSTPNGVTRQKHRHQACGRGCRDGGTGRKKGRGRCRRGEKERFKSHMPI